MDESSPDSPKVELSPTFESMFSSFKQRVTFSKSKKQAATTDLDGKAADIQQGTLREPLIRPVSPEFSDEATPKKDGSSVHAHHAPQFGHHGLPAKDYESLDYDICYNVPYKENLREYRKRTYMHTQVMRWVLVGIIGFLTGVVAFLIDICVRHLVEVKFDVFDKVYNATIGNGSIFLAFLVLLGFNVLFAIIAAFLVFAVPVAAGSGIPEIKCYLNGVKVPRVTRVTTLVSKAVGVLFAVAGGFFVGKEGPMIHSGAIIGAGIPQFRSIILKFIKFPYPYFRSDRDKRDFVSSGAAAGVAAAFGAPIGGVLFSLEEGSSFWNQALTWRTLFCSFCATFTLNFFTSLSRGQNIGHIKLGSPGLVNFGTFSTEEGTLWNAYHLIIFMLMGAVGGLLGALFNSLNITLSKYRMRFLHRRGRIWKVFEAILIVAVTTASVFIAATFLGTCVRENTPTTPDDCPEFGDSTFRNETRNYFCPQVGTYTYFNDMATLMFNTQEVAVKQLFHQNGVFTLPTLWIIFLVYFFIACWTYGAGIPSGLFIPSLLIGAAYGRFVATVFGYLNYWRPDIFGFLINIYPGTYALIGAASFLGGVVRMTISLTVILIESTNEISLGLPIMLSLLVAKWVGDIFNEGLYDHHIELKSTPFLGWESPDRMDRLIAADVMNSENLCYVYPITRVRSVENLLRTTAHGAFLVVTPVSTKDMPMRKKNISESHVPALYTRPSRVELHSDGLDVKEVEMEQAVTLVRSRTFNASYTLPQHRKKKSNMGTRSRTYTDGNDGAPSQTSAAPDEESDHVEVLMFHGIILRSQLVEMIKNKTFFDEKDGPENQEIMSYSTLTKDYPRYPTVQQFSLTDAEKDMLMDLSVYMNPCPYTITHEAPLPQVFNLFRTMGLRHLPVLKEPGIVVGIITRHDLTHEKLHEKRHLKKLREERSKKTMKEL